MTDIDSAGLSSKISEESEAVSVPAREVHSEAEVIKDRRDTELKVLAEGLADLDKRLTLLRNQLSRDVVSLESNAMLSERELLAILSRFKDVDLLSDDICFGLFKMFVKARDSGDDLSAYCKRIEDELCSLDKNEGQDKDKSQDKEDTKTEKDVKPEQPTEDKKTDKTTTGQKEQSDNAVGYSGLKAKIVKSLSEAPNIKSVDARERAYINNIKNNSPALSDAERAQLLLFLRSEVSERKKAIGER